MRAHFVPGLRSYLSEVPNPANPYSVSTNSWLVRKIGSQNQSIVLWHYSHYWHFQKKTCLSAKAYASSASSWEVSIATASAAARSGAPARLLSLCQMGNVPCVNEHCRTYGWVMSHRWMSRVTHIRCSAQRCASSATVSLQNGSCPVREWATLHIWMNHAAHMHESCHTHHLQRAEVR